MGTAFNIRHREEQVTVTVTEGRVEIKPDSAQLAGSDQQLTSLQYNAGEQITFNSEITQVTSLDPHGLKRVIAWRHGKLIFHQATLASIVKEVQLYVPNEIVIADDSISDMVGGGVFNTQNATSILTAIEYSMPVNIIRRGDVIILARKPEDRR